MAAAGIDNFYVCLRATVGRIVISFLFLDSAESLIILIFSNMYKEQKKNEIGLRVTGILKYTSVIARDTFKN